MDKSATRGQAQVELALVLPCFCLGVFMAVQLMTYCHNMIELQRMAESMAGRQSYRRNQHQYNLFHSLWGNIDLPNPKTQFEKPRPWRRFRGKTTVDETGWLFKTKVSAKLKTSGYFTGLLGEVNQNTLAESYLEPPVPPEE